MSKLHLILQIMNQIVRQRKKLDWIEKVIGLIKDELGAKIMTKFVGLKAKTDSYLLDRGSEDKKSKKPQKVCYQKNT